VISSIRHVLQSFPNTGTANAAATANNNSGVNNKTDIKFAP
jgi:hypothetical protein